MKKIIYGKIYDTETATELYGDCNGLSCTDFRHMEESLYVTKKGAFFLAGSGGAMTKYSRSFADTSSAGEDLFPIPKKEALEWLERHGCIDAIELYFADDIEEA